LDISESVTQKIGQFFLENNIKPTAIISSSFKALLMVMNSPESTFNIPNMDQLIMAEHFAIWENVKKELINGGNKFGIGLAIEERRNGVLMFSLINVLTSSNLEK
jgi:hypothetical protein